MTPGVPGDEGPQPERPVVELLAGVRLDHGHGLDDRGPQAVPGAEGAELHDKAGRTDALFKGLKVGELIPRGTSWLIHLTKAYL